MNIAIFGDSSSSSIGNKKKTYPYKLFKLLKKNHNVIIKNYSSIGITSSDIRVFFHQNFKKFCFNYLIIYLGNNESVYSNKKGYINFYYWKLKNFFNYNSNTYHNHNFLKKKYTFNHFKNFNEIANNKEEYYKNLISIIKPCIKKKVKIILINPIANRNFLPSVKINNFEYFKFIDFKESISSKLHYTCSDSKKLIDAIRLSEINDLDGSKKIYENLIDSTKNKNIYFIAKNNYGVILFDQNLIDLSKKVFEELLIEDNNCKSIYYYNLSLIYKNQSDQKNYLNYKNLSYKNDFYSYRIKDDYRETNTKILHNFKIYGLDLEKFLTQKDFIDSCHPTNNGHNKIAENIFKLLSKENCKNSSKINNYKSILLNPDYFNSPKKTFYDYYLINKKIENDEIKKNITSYKKNYNCENKFIKNFFDQISKHPLISTSNNFYKKLTFYENELFSYPENFIHRFLFNLMNEIEKNNYNYLFSKYKFIKNKLFYKDIILKKESKNYNIIIENISDYIHNDLSKKIVHFIEKNNTIFSNQIHFRKKTYMKWYTRESFRYGTVSEPDMLYDRVNLDILVESTVGLLIKDKKKFDIEIILNLIFDIFVIHRNHIKKFLYTTKSPSIEYEIQLKKIKNKLISYLK